MVWRPSGLNLLPKGWAPWPLVGEVASGIRGATSFSESDYLTLANFAENGSTKDEFIWGVVAANNGAQTGQPAGFSNQARFTFAGAAGQSMQATVRDANNTTLTATNVFPDNPFNFTFVAVASWVRDGNKSLWVDKVAEHIVAGSAAGNLFDNPMHLGANSGVNPFTDGTVYSIWRASAKTWNQTKQDAWYDALKADPANNLYPADADDAWTFAGAVVGTPVPPVKGSGASIQWVGTPTLVDVAAPLWRP